MKIGYFGTPDISAALLAALLESTEHEVAFVVANPDRRQGRSKKLVPNPVAALALERGLPLYRPETLSEPDVVAQLAGHEAELFVVFAYGKILPENIFTIPQFGSVNLHASLLPKLRGASPIQSAVMQGMSVSGWTLQKIARAMDTGDIIAQAPLKIDPDETALELQERMVPVGIELVLDVLNNFNDLYQRAEPQSDYEATYCSKLTTEMAWIDWSSPATEIHNLIRATAGWPVARARINGSELKLHRSALAAELPMEIEESLAERAAGGIVVFRSGREKILLVKTGRGVLQLLTLQPLNKRTMSAADFLNGFRLEEGDSFELIRNEH